MNRVQELIDESMGELPVALAKKLLDACKEEADAVPRLHTVTYVRLHPYLMDDGGSQIIGEKRIFIAEEHTPSRYFDDADHATLLADGKVHRDWVNKPMPVLLHVRHTENVVAIVTEIAPYRKRGRP